MSVAAAGQIVCPICPAAKKNAVHATLRVLYGGPTVGPPRTSYRCGRCWWSVTVLTPSRALTDVTS